MNLYQARIYIQQSFESLMGGKVEAPEPVRTTLTAVRGGKKSSGS